MKYIKLSALIFALLTAALFLSCAEPLPEPADIAGNPQANAPPGVFAEIFERMQIYENLYDDGIESENLKAAVREAKRLTLEGVPDDEEILRLCLDIERAEAAFIGTYTQPGKSRAESGLINKLYINDIKCAFDAASGTFFYTMGKEPDKELKFIFFAENSGGEKVFAEVTGEGTGLNWKFIPEQNKTYTLRAHTKERFYDYNIIFTMLPLIQINEVTGIGDEYRDAVISVTDPDFTYQGLGGAASAPGGFYFESNAGIKFRGAMARSFPKKSYAVKFRDSGGNKNVRLFNMRSDSDWILDAMAVDRSRLRNRAAFDIWNNMSSPLYYEKEGQNLINGTLGVFVELFLNDEYMGLYCFTEKIDRKQLGLDRNEGELKSVSYKGRHWGDVLLFRRYEQYNNGWSWWANFEQKYPNPDKDSRIEWAPLADFIRFFVESSDEEFAAGAEKYIDIQNFADYTLFLIISYAYDNTGKNAYWSVYDLTDDTLNKIFITPWDLDGSWGTSWNGDKLRGSENGPWMDSELEHDTELFRRLVLTNAGNFADILRATWERLKHGALSPESILAVFNDYFDLFELSGAWEREKKRWEGELRELNLENEREFINEWVPARWSYTDNLIENELQLVGRYSPAPPRPRQRR